MNALVGYRTYLTAFSIVVVAAVAFLTGEVTLGQAINDALLGTGLAALRAAK